MAVATENQQLYQEIKSLISEQGMRTSEAIRMVAERSGKRPGTLSAVYYRGAERDPDGLVSRSGEGRRGRPRAGEGENGTAGPRPTRRRSRAKTTTANGSDEAQAAETTTTTRGRRSSAGTRRRASGTSARRSRTATAAPASSSAGLSAQDLMQMAERFTALEAEVVELRAKLERVRAAAA